MTRNEAIGLEIERIRQQRVPLSAALLDNRRR
jgi:hypothetical protein